MCCIGNLSGQIATLTNPTSQTEFALSAGGNAYIPLEFGKLLRFLVVGAVNFDSGSSDGDNTTYNVLIGDPTNIAGAVSIQDDAIAYTPSVTYRPFILNYLLYLDSTKNKIYAWPADDEVTGNLGGLSISQNFSGGTNQSISGISKYNIFMTEQFSASHSGNNVVLNTFKVEEVLKNN